MLLNTVHSLQSRPNFVELFGDWFCQFVGMFEIWIFVYLLHVFIYLFIQFIINLMTSHKNKELTAIISLGQIWREPSQRNNKEVESYNVHAIKVDN